jgi:hypothetical protein
VSQYAVGIRGALIPRAVEAVDAPGTGGAYAVASPDGQSLYVTEESTDTIAQYDVSADGLLTPKRPAAIGTADDPIGLAMTPNGSGLYAASYCDRSVIQYQTLENGALTARRPGSRVDAGLNAFGMAVVDRPTAARDVLHGTAGANVICGLGGGDVIRGLGGDDTLYGDGCGGRAGPGRAGAAAAAGADRLYGDAGDDRLYGGAGRDLLRGGRGNDRLNARDGRRDRVVCGRGRDVVKADPNDRLNGFEQVGRNSP